MTDLLARAAKKRAAGFVWRRDNVEHIRKKRREDYLKDPDAMFFKHLLRDYGVTRDQYLQLVEDQGNRCAVCKRSPEEATKRGFRLHLDHCHLTGRVRGLLCSRCNRVLGMLHDSVELLGRLKEYLG